MSENIDLRLVIGDKNISADAVDGVVVFETKYLTIPLSHMAIIASAVGAELDETTQRQVYTVWWRTRCFRLFRYVVDCNRISSLPDLKLTLNAQTYRMSSRNYTETVGDALPQT